MGDRQGVPLRDEATYEAAAAFLGLTPFTESRS